MKMQNIHNYTKTILIIGAMLFSLGACTSYRVDSRAPFRMVLPEQEMISKTLFDGVALMQMPKKSKTSYDRRRQEESGEAGSLRIKGFEERPIVMWDIQLYDSDAEEEYQTAEWIKGFKGKGVERRISTQNKVVRFDLPKALRNYPGGKQSMFRLDTSNKEGTKVIRALVYCLDDFCGSDEQRDMVHLQIKKMLESISFEISAGNGDRRIEVKYEDISPHFFKALEE